MDPGESQADGKVLFPEPTVSKVHAELLWDEAKNRYLLIHRSQTNPTLVNGTRVNKARHLNPGDRLAMGRLTLEIRIGIGQHTQADIAEVDVAALTRAASATAPEIVTWVANTPVSSPAPAPPVAPMPSRIPPPARKPWPTPAFEQPYDPVPVDPAALAAPPEWQRAEPVEAEEERVAMDVSPRRIALEPVEPESTSLLVELQLAEEVSAVEESSPAEEVSAVEESSLAEPIETPGEARVEGPTVEAVVEPVEEPVHKPGQESAPEPVTVKQKPYVRPSRKIGRNEPCPCGSGKKFKKCCLS